MSNLNPITPAQSASGRQTLAELRAEYKANGLAYSAATAALVAHYGFENARAILTGTIRPTEAVAANRKIAMAAANLPSVKAAPVALKVAKVVEPTERERLLARLAELDGADSPAPAPVAVKAASAPVAVKPEPKPEITSADVPDAIREYASHLVWEDKRKFVLKFADAVESEADEIDAPTAFSPRLSGDNGKKTVERLIRICRPNDYAMAALRAVDAADKLGSKFPRA
jgi:hypothetical protein